MSGNPFVLATLLRVDDTNDGEESSPRSSSTHLSPQQNIVTVRHGAASVCWWNLGDVAAFVAQVRNHVITSSVGVKSSQNFKFGRGYIRPLPTRTKVTVHGCRLGKDGQLTILLLECTLAFRELGLH